MQTLCYNKVETGPELCAKIEAVTAKDLQRVAFNMFEAKPTIACFGDVTNVPGVDNIQMWIESLLAKSKMGPSNARVVRAG